MKYLLLFALLLTPQAFAFDICSFEETTEFHDALEAEGIKATKSSKNHKKFTFSEKKMIHLTVASQEWLRGVSLEEALEIFGDYYEGKQGANAGEIIYYQISGKKVALVHYWPGDNEVGAFYQVKRDGSFKLTAKVEDSWISCEK